MADRAGLALQRSQLVTPERWQRAKSLFGRALDQLLSRPDDFLQSVPEHLSIVDESGECAGCQFLHSRPAVRGPDQHADVIGIQHQLRTDAYKRRRFPIRLHQKFGNNVSDVDHARKKENVLDALIIAARAEPRKVSGSLWSAREK